MNSASERARVAILLANQAAALLPGPGLIFVNTAADFPAPVAGVITLAAETTYFLTTTIDIGASRIQGSQDSSFIGGSSENSGLIASGLSQATPLLSSSFSMPMRDLFITHGVAIAFDGQGVAGRALDWQAVNFVDCDAIGTIGDYDNVIITDSAFLNSGPLTISGTLDTLGLTGVLISVAPGKTGIIVPAAATVTRRFRVIYSAVVVPVGASGLDVDPIAIGPNEAFILDTVNFAGGGNYLPGLTAQDNEALFTNCTGVGNSADVAQYGMNGNAVATVISTPGDFVLAAGVTSPGSAVAKFVVSTANRATYIGALNNFFKVTAVIGVSGSANKQIAARIARNGVPAPTSQAPGTTNSGGRVENVVCQHVDTLVDTQYFEVWIANLTDTSNLTITDLNVLIERLT